MPSLGTMSVSFGADTSSLMSGLNAAKKALGSFSDGANSTKSALGSLSGGADSARSALGTFAGGLISIVGVGLLSAGAAAIKFGADSVKMAGDFQSSLTTLVTGAGESQKNIKMVGDGIKQMSIETGTSTKDLVAGMYQIESSGMHGADGLNVLKISAEGARVGNADLGVVANSLTTILTDYHMSSSQAAVAMNGLTATVSSGKTTLQALGSSMGSILPLASSLGISFPNVAGAIAVMTNSGMSAQRASTNLANALRSLSAPGGVASSAMASVGLSAQDLKDTLTNKGLPAAIQLIEDHVGKTFPAGSVKGVQAFKDIMGGATGYNVALMLGGKNMKTFEDNVKNITNAMNNGKGSVTGWADVQQDFNFRMDQAKQAVDALKISIGERLLPILGQIVSKVTENISKFADWVMNNKQLAQTIDTVKTKAKEFWDLIKPIFQGSGNSSFLTTLGDNLKRVGKIMMDMSPAVNIFEGISRHAKELGDWVQNSVVPAFKQAEPGFNHLQQSLSDLLPLFQQISDIIHNNFQKAFDALLPSFKEAIPLLIQLSGIISDGLGRSIAFIAPYIKQAADELGKFTDQITTRVSPGIKQWLDQTKQGLDFFKAHWDQIWGLIGPGIQVIWDQIVGTVKVSWAIVSGIIKIGLDIMSGNWGQIWTDMKDTMSGIWDGIKTILGDDIKQTVLGFKPLFDMLSKIPGPVGDMAKSVLKSMDDMSAGTKEKTQAMANAADINTLNMKIKTLTNVEEMHKGAVLRLELMRSEITQKIQNTTDPVQKKTLEMALVSINNSLKMEQGTVANIEVMKNSALQKIDDMKNGATSKTASMSSSVTAQIDTMQKNATAGAQLMSKNVQARTLDMADQVVGHSIVPDMVTRVIAWFAKLPSGALSAVSGLMNTMGGFFSNLAGNAVSWGRNVIQGVINGISSMLGSLGSTASNVASIIAAHIGFHSPTKLGPGRDADKWGPNLVKMFSNDLVKGAPKLQSAVNTLVQPLSLMNTSQVSYSTPAQQPVIHNHIYLDGKELSGHIGQLVVDKSRRLGARI